MGTDYQKEYTRYLSRFEAVMDGLETGQYGRYKGRLVPKMGPKMFAEKVDEYMSLGEKFSESVNRGDTIDDVLVVQLRAAETELVLEESLFLPPS